MQSKEWHFLFLCFCSLHLELRAVSGPGKAVAHQRFSGPSSALHEASVQDSGVPTVQRRRGLPWEQTSIAGQNPSAPHLTRRLQRRELKVTGPLTTGASIAMQYPLPKQQPAQSPLQKLGGRHPSDVTTSAIGTTSAVPTTPVVITTPVVQTDQQASTHPGNFWITLGSGEFTYTLFRKDDTRKYVIVFVCVGSLVILSRVLAGMNLVIWPTRWAWWPDFFVSSSIFSYRTVAWFRLLLGLEFAIVNLVDFGEVYGESVYHYFLYWTQWNMTLSSIWFLLGAFISFRYGANRSSPDTPPQTLEEFNLVEDQPSLLPPSVQLYWAIGNILPITESCIVTFGYWYGYYTEPIVRSSFQNMLPKDKFLAYHYHGLIGVGVAINAAWVKQPILAEHIIYPLGFSCCFIFMTWAWAVYPNGKDYTIEHGPFDWREGSIENTWKSIAVFFVVLLSVWWIMGRCFNFINYGGGGLLFTVNDFKRKYGVPDAIPEKESKCVPEASKKRAEHRPEQKAPFHDEGNDHTLVLIIGFFLLLIATVCCWLIWCDLEYAVRINEPHQLKFHQGWQ